MEREEQLPNSAAVRQYAEGIVREAGQDQNFERYLPVALEDAVNLGFIPEDEAPAVQHAVTAEISLNGRLRALVRSSPRRSGIDLGMLLENQISIDETYSHASTAVNGAHGLVTLVGALNEQGRRFHTEPVLSSEIPTVTYMFDRGVTSHEALLQVEGVSLRMLKEVAYTLRAVSSLVVDAVDAVQVTSDVIMEVLHSIPQAKDGTIQINSVERALAYLRHPAIPVNELAKELDLGRFVNIYNTWRQCKKTLYEQGVYAPDEFGPSERSAMPETLPPRKSAETYQTEVNQLVGEHEELVAKFRMPSNQIKKGGFRDLSNALVRCGQAGAGVTVATSEDAKRLIGVLCELERLGPNPDKARGVFYTALPTEEAIGTHLHSSTARSKPGEYALISRGGRRWLRISRCCKSSGQ